MEFNSLEEGAGAEGVFWQRRELEAFGQVYLHEGLNLLEQQHIPARLF